ncbi:retrovirus-related pol polyprotein from transposon TNT 1-94 [Tanacetum coccineum]
MLAPKCLTFNGRPTFANLMYLKKAQNEKPCLYEIPHDQSDPANSLVPNKEETLTLERESRANNSQVKDKKTEVEDHPRISSISNKTKFVTACNDNLKSKTLNVNSVCATYGKCVFNSNHGACVSKFLNDMNARTKKPKLVPISTRKPKSQANKSIAAPPKKIVALESTIHKSKSYYRMLYEKISKAWKWWIEQQCLSGYKWVPKTKMKWVPKTKNENVKKRVSFAIDNVSRITNILKLTNSLGSNLSNIPSSSNSLADFSTHPIHYLQGNDLLTGNSGSNLYTISLQETTSSTPICLMAKASPTQAWLWHRRLSYLNFDYINLLSKKDVVIGLPKLKYVKDQLCSSCEVASFPNDKRHQIMTTLASSPNYNMFLLQQIQYVNNSSSANDNSKQQDTPPTTNIQSSIEPINPTNVNAEENNDNQEEDAQKRAFISLTDYKSGNSVDKPFEVLITRNAFAPVASAVKAEESKEEESKRKRKLGTRKKMKPRKRRFIQNTSEDDSEKENDELRLHLTIAPDEEKEVDYEILDRKYPIKEWKNHRLIKLNT